MTTEPQREVMPFEAMTPAQQLQHLHVAHAGQLADDGPDRTSIHTQAHDDAEWAEGRDPGHFHASLTQHIDQLVQLPESAMERHWRQYDHALARATALAELSDHAWEGADRHGKVVTYGDSGVPCHEVAAMFAAQASAWAAIAHARWLPMQPPGGGL